MNKKLIIDKYNKIQWHLKKEKAETQKENLPSAK